MPDTINFLPNKSTKKVATKSSKTTKKQLGIGWKVLIVISFIMGATAFVRTYMSEETMGIGNQEPMFRGQDGKKGDRGFNGTNGRDGVDGQDGNDGEKGDRGFNGTNGQDGVNGTNGQDGGNGQDGEKGDRGFNGTNGQDGVDGEIGPRGCKHGFKVVGNSCVDVCDDGAKTNCTNANKEVCSEGVNSIACGACKHGWDLYGDSCACSDNADCGFTDGGRGQCNDVYVCECASGFAGAACHLTDCPSGGCGGHGDCVLNEENPDIPGSCICNEGFYGAGCMGLPG